MTTDKLLEAIKKIVEVTEHELVFTDKDAAEEISQFFLDNCAGGSITGPFETEYWDFQKLEQELGVMLSVNDYDDLICDPHGIMND